MDKTAEQVADLLGQLSNMGYRQFQLEQIIRDSFGTSSLESLSIEQTRRLIGVLAEYANFAAKCRLTMKS